MKADSYLAHFRVCNWLTLPLYSAFVYNIEVFCLLAKV